MCDTELDWHQIYWRLRRDRADGVAWQTLERRVRAWLRADAPAAGEALDDAVAEVVAAVYASFGQARGADTFRGFVHGHRLNVRRRLWSTARTACVSLEEIDPMGHVAVPAPENAETSDDLDTALATLPWREREAISLRYDAGLSTEQIAEALSVSQVNARQIVFQGLARLRRQLAA